MGGLGETVAVPARTVPPRPPRGTIRPMLGASIVTLLLPLWIILGLLLIIGVLATLARVQNGRYLRPLVVL